MEKGGFQTLEADGGQTAPVQAVIGVQQLGLAGVSFDEDGGQSDVVGEGTGDIGGKLLAGPGDGRELRRAVTGVLGTTRAEKVTVLRFRSAARNSVS